MDRTAPPERRAQQGQLEVRALPVLRDRERPEQPVQRGQTRRSPARPDLPGPRARQALLVKTDRRVQLGQQEPPERRGPLAVREQPARDQMAQREQRGQLGLRAQLALMVRKVHPAAMVRMDLLGQRVRPAMTDLPERQVLLGEPERLARASREPPAQLVLPATQEVLALREPQERRELPVLELQALLVLPERLDRKVRLVRQGWTVQMGQPAQRVLPDQEPRAQPAQPELLVVLESRARQEQLVRRGQPALTPRRLAPRGQLEPLAQPESQVRAEPQGPPEGPVRPARAALPA
jgi:hypothetical protein